MTPIESGSGTCGIGKLSLLSFYHIKNVKIRVRMRPRLQFEGALVLESESDSHLSPSRPPSCCAHPISCPAPCPCP
jgi:hypothetical protein